MAYDSHDGMVSFYLDVETGEVLNITEEESSMLEMIYENYYDEGAGSVDWEAAFEEEGIPEWQRMRLKEVDPIRAGSGERFIRIPPRSLMKVTAIWKPLSTP